MGEGPGLGVTACPEETPPEPSAPAAFTPIPTVVRLAFGDPSSTPIKGEGLNGRAATARDDERTETAPASLTGEALVVVGAGGAEEVGLVGVDFFLDLVLGAGEGRALHRL